MIGRLLSSRWRATSGPWALLCTVVGFIYLFSLGPILITAAVSFNQTNRSFFPPRGFSLRWWERALLLGGALLLIFPGVWSDLLGAACLAVTVASQRLARP